MDINIKTSPMSHFDHLITITRRATDTIEIIVRIILTKAGTDRYTPLMGGMSLVIGLHPETEFSEVRITRGVHGELVRGIISAILSGPIRHACFSI